MSFFHAVILALAGALVAPCLLMSTTEDVGLAAYVALTEAVEDPGDDVIEVSILALKNAKYRPGRALPKWIRELDGKRVELWGYMAIGTLEGLDQFELVPESCECGRSRVNHFVDVSLTDGSTRFIPGRITLTGIFHASEVKVDGFIKSLYRLRTDRLPR